MKKTISVLILTAGSMFAAETITGLLMDATCSAITSRPKAGTNTTSAANKPAPVTAGPADASATGTTGAASNDAAGTGARRSKAAAEPDRSMRRETEASTRGVATAGPSWSSATGTTGAAVDAVPPQPGRVEQARTQRDSANRTESSESETVAEKYAACKANDATSAFAIHANGKLYILDDESNQMVRKQMRNEAFRASMSNGRDGSRWMTVTLMGTPGAGNSLHLESVRK